MKTLLANNKSLFKLLALVLSVLLVVALIPQIQIAYSDPNAHLEDTEQTDLAGTGDETGDPDEGLGDEGNEEGLKNDLAGTGEGDEEEMDEEALAAWLAANGGLATLSNDGEGKGEGGGGEEPLPAGEESLKVVKDADETITLNGGVYQYRHIVVTNGKTLTINGTGTINAGGTPATYTDTVNNENRTREIGSVIVVENGAKLIIDGAIHIRGGVGTAVTTTAFSVPKADRDQVSELNLPSNFVGGGGILVQRQKGTESWGTAGASTGSSLELKGGAVVENNEAAAGGGIFIDRDCSFYMTGETTTIQNNTATTFEGGGLFIAGKTDGRNGQTTGKTHTTIDQGKIINNHTQTKYSLGGGGIFIESQGYLKIGSPLITDNIADGLGGGIAGCPHAYIGIGPIFGDANNIVSQGAAIYGNDAFKRDSAWPKNSFLHCYEVASAFSSDKIESGDKFAREDGRFTAALAKDYYCVKGSSVYGADFGQAGEVAWTGYKAGPEITNGPVTVNKGDSVNVYDATLGLASTYDPVKEGEITGRSVVITGNTSTTHGGGIGCNGSLVIGDLTKSDYYGPLLIDVQKTYESVEDTGRQTLSMTEGQFNFRLLDANYQQVATGTNDASGNVQFTLSGKQYLQGMTNGSKKTLTFYVQEIAGSNNFTSYDGKPASTATSSMPTHKVTVEITARVERSVNVKGSTAVTNYSVAEKTVTVEGGAIKNTFNYTNEYQYGLINLEVNKDYVNSLGQDVAFSENGGEFSFRLSGADGGDKTASNDASGKVTFTNLKIDSYLGNYTTADCGTEKEVTFTVVEVAGDNSNIVYDSNTYEVKFGVVGHVEGSPSKDSSTGKKTYTIKPEIVPGSMSVRKVGASEASAEAPTFVNTLNLEEKETYTGFSLGFGKDFYTVLDLAPEQKLAVAEGDFTFKLTDANGIEFESDTDENGEVWFTIPTFEKGENETEVEYGNRVQDYLKSLYASAAFGDKEDNHDGTFTQRATLPLTFILTEVVPTDTDEYVVYDQAEDKNHTVVVTLNLARKHDSENDTATDNVTIMPTIATITVDGAEVDNGEGKIVNRYKPHGFWQLKLGKHLYSGNTPFSFTMAEVAAPEPLSVGNLPLANNGVTADDGTYLDTMKNPVIEKMSGREWPGTTGTYDENGYAEVTFASPTYIANGIEEGNTNDIGDHWYLVSEDGAFVNNAMVSGMDSTVYLIQVNVYQDADNLKQLNTEVLNVWYADDPVSGMWYKIALSDDSKFVTRDNFTTITNVSSDVAFYNTDTNMALAMASYSVYAASGEVIDQVCYVDPKIIKNLEGRAIQADEFEFELRRVEQTDGVKGFLDADGNVVTDGLLISKTKNDEFGMVDFDKAADKTGNLENPSCLEYTQEGTYYYIVVETDGQKDTSIIYNPEGEVITFTTVIEPTDDGGLECTNMYYGHLVDTDGDGKADTNVPYPDQYKEGNTAEPGTSAAFAMLNESWHPTLNNVVKPMDLQVRKTSVSDRSEGLEGATYGLYMVNDNKQGDILLDQQTSDADGWITFKNVSLSENTLYYFKEIAAPAGHTVSEFRSAYFQVVESKKDDKTYYTLQYLDSKFQNSGNGTVDTGTVNDELVAVPLALEDEAAEGAETAEGAEGAEAANNATANAFASEDPVTYSDDGNLLLTYALDGGVYDEVTDVSFNKLDTRTHEWVQGAKLAIIEKDSGKEMVSWVSGAESKQVQKTLNVGVTYILREIEAPANYHKAGDVEFVIDKYGKVEILSGTSNGNADLSDSTITLYDTMMDAEEVDRQERETLIQRLAQTGDLVPLVGLGLVALASLALVITSVIRRRKLSEE